MADDIVLSKYQEKRRADFKLQALKVLMKYDKQKLLNAIKVADESGYKEWMKDYHALLSQGEAIDRLTENEFRVFVMAVYGWMPVLYSQQDIQKLKINIQILLNSKFLEKKIILEAMQCFKSSKHKSGSISALSKVLHFCKPDKFPVWDTRVANALGRKSGTGNNINIYLDYLSVMADLNLDITLDNYYANYKKSVDKMALKIRALEHGLFLKR